MRKIYDEENQNPYDDDDKEFDGFEMDDSVSVFRTYIREAIESVTEATPIPEGEQTVILADPSVAGIADGAQVTPIFSGETCDMYSGARKIGSLKAAFVRKLYVERGGQLATVYFKKDTPPMVRIVFGEGTPIPEIEE